MQAGVDGYLVKPIGVAALIREIERALSQAAQRLTHGPDAFRPTSS